MEEAAFDRRRGYEDERVRCSHDLEGFPDEFVLHEPKPTALESSRASESNRRSSPSGLLHPLSIGLLTRKSSPYNL